MSPRQEVDIKSLLISPERFAAYVSSHSPHFRSSPKDTVLSSTQNILPAASAFRTVQEENDFLRRTVLEALFGRIFPSALCSASI